MTLTGLLAPARPMLAPRPGSTTEIVLAPAPPIFDGGELEGRPKDTTPTTKVAPTNRGEH